jgi:hypothetical protein
LRQREASLKVEVAQALMEARQADLLEAAHAVPTGAGSPVGVDTRIHLFQYLDHVNQLLNEAKDKASAARERLLEADQRRKEATTDAEALESLRDAEWKEYQQQMARQVRYQLDEIAIQRWVGPQTNRRFSYERQ